MLMFLPHEWVLRMQHILERINCENRCHNTAVRLFHGTDSSEAVSDTGHNRSAQDAKFCPML